MDRIENEGPTVTPSRPSVRRDRIVDEFRRRIVRGQLKPGVRLPTRVEIRDRYRVSLATVQEALNRLAQDGFVVAHGKNGTTVAERPPHLHQYALVSHARPGQRGWSLFHTGLCHAAAALGQERNCRFRYYHGVSASERTPEYLRLLEDTRASRLAGLIAINSPEDTLGRSELALNPPLPLVGISGNTALPKAHLVVADWHDFYERAVERLVTLGRRRLAVIADESMQADGLEHCRRLLECNGLSAPPYWFQVVGHHNPLSASRCVHLLLHNPSDRPDGLILADDNIVEASLAGVLESGARVPQDLEIAAYCNFPWTPKTPLPIRTLGFHARQIVEACLDLIDRKRSGQPVPRTHRLTVLDEEAVSAAETMETRRVEENEHVAR